MIIRSEQMEAFDRLSFQNFENEAIEHAREFAPRHCEVLGEERTRTAVRAGIQRAGQYGLTSRGPVHLFLDLMFLLGSEFDTDPQYPWAGAILADRTIRGQVERADRLHATSIEYLDKTYGPENQFAIAALRSIARAAESLERRTQRGLPDARAALNVVYPQKSAELSDAALHGIIAHAAAIAKKSSITSETGIALLITLEVALGHAFASDPLYFWIRTTLEADVPPDGNDRARLLHKKTMAYLTGALSYLEAK